MYVLQYSIICCSWCMRVINGAGLFCPLGSPLHSSVSLVLTVSSTHCLACLERSASIHTRFPPLLFPWLAPERTCLWLSSSLRCCGVWVWCRIMVNAHGTVGTAQCQDQRAPGAAVHLPSLSPHRAGDSNMSQTEYEVGGYKAALDMNKKKL